MACSAAGERVRYWPTPFLAEDSQIMIGEEQNILGTFPEGGQCERDHVQTVKEILAKAASANFGLQRTVRCGDQSNIGLPFPRLPKTLVRPVVEKPEEPHLSVGCQLTNFVKEQRSAFGFLDLAGDIGHGTGEGSLAMTEKGARHQIG